MSESQNPENWWLLTRARGVALLLRVLIVVSPLVALGCTLLAADRDLPVIKFVVVVLALACVVFPDTHVGLLAAILIGIDWWVTVDDVASPWSIPVAVALLVFHASLAAAGVAPAAAAWTRSMCRRWARRCVVVALACPVTWAFVAAVQQRQPASSQVLLAASVLTLAIAGVWARSGTLGIGDD